MISARGLRRLRPSASDRSGPGAPRPEGDADRKAFLTSLWIGLAFGMTFVLRFNGHWAEIDSAVFTLAIDRLQQYRSIFHPGQYEHGYAYSVWGATLGNLTGLEPTTLVRWLVPVFGCALLGVVGYTVHRAWTSSPRVAVFATVALFLTPEVVFTFARNNHEKITVSLVLIAAWAIAAAFRAVRAGAVGRFVALIVVHHVMAFTILSLNTVFGAAFVGASTLVTLGAGALSLLPGLRPVLAPVSRTLAVALSVSWLLLILIAWDAYPQTSGKSLIFERVAGGILALFSEQEIASNPFVENTAGGGIWRSTLVQRMVSSFRPILMAGSFVTWVVMAFVALRRGRATSVDRWFLLAWYGAYGFVLALAVPIDLVGIYGSNLSVRMFTYFAVFAAPLLAYGALFVHDRLLARLPRRPVRVVLGAAAAFFVVASLVKATLDPLASRFWLSYTEGEIRAVEHWNHVQTSSWMYGTPRLRAGYIMSYAEQPSRGNAIESDADEPYVSFALDSDLFRSEILMLGLPVAPFPESDVVYDNGDARLLHRLPATPFQR